MTVFLFWNLKLKNLGALVSEAAREHDADVIVLAECPDPYRILQALNEPVRWKYNYHASPSSPVEVYSRYPPNGVLPLADVAGLSFRQMRDPLGLEILLVGAHLPSKRYWSDSSQAMTTSVLRTEIARIEAKLGHRRTLIVGDFNMNPFELGLVDANGFHAVSSKAIASRGSRTIRGQEYAFFYNPMWSLLGDSGSAPPGTYYRDAADSYWYYWYMFDQLLLRPELVSGFVDESLKIITAIAGVPLLRKNGRINATLASDHLPIKFEIILQGDIQQ